MEQVSILHMAVCDKLRAGGYSRANAKLISIQFSSILIDTKIRRQTNIWSDFCLKIVYKGLCTPQANGPVRKKCYVIVPFEGEDMLVPVEYKGVSKWVRVPKTEEVFDYSQFLQGGILNVMSVNASRGFTVSRTSNCVMTPIEVIFFGVFLFQYWQNSICQVSWPWSWRIRPEWKWIQIYLMNFWSHLMCP